MTATVLSRLSIALSLIVAGWIIDSSAIAETRKYSAQIVQTGLIDCFPEGLRTSNGKLVYAEASAVVHTGKWLIIANDKPILGRQRSPVFTIDYRQWLSKSGVTYRVTPILVNAMKYEGLTVTPEGNFIIATTAFDRVKPDSDAWNGYNTLVAWPNGSPDASAIVTIPPQKDAISSVSLREHFSRALKTGSFPDGVPYFKIEGLAAIPGNKLQFGGRANVRRNREVEDSGKIVSVDYTIRNGQVILAENFKVIYDYDFTANADIVKPVGLSGLEYDSHGDRLYLLTSYELNENDEGLGGYVWVLPIQDLFANKAPILVRDRSARPLMFAHKPEGVAVLGANHILVVHDDDKVLGREKVEDPKRQFSKRPNQAAYAIVRFLD